MDIRFDFTQATTRTSILEQLYAVLDEAQRAHVAETLASVDIAVEHCHDIGEVNEVIDALPVSDAVKADMKGVYDILAHAEAKVHECEVEHTHFHEVGNRSGISNTLEICLAFAELGEGARVSATPLQVGSGKIECAHGLMDVPAPATAAILEQGLPVCDQKLDGELCTPTSAAIVKYFVQEFEV